MYALPFRLRRLSAWIALVALVLAALAPTLTHAIGSTAAQGWSAVCTTTGMKWVNADGRVSEAAPEGMTPSLDCPCCHLQHAAAMPAPRCLVRPVGAPAGTVFPAAFYTAPSRLHAWCTASPRGPPAAA